MAFTPLVIVRALTFIGLPFVVRTVQPVLEELDSDVEEAAAGLGASRWQTFRRVIFPSLLPAVLTGFALAFARALGEYGSVIFISGNMRCGRNRPTFDSCEARQYDYAGATAIAPSAGRVVGSCSCQFAPAMDAQGGSMKGDSAAVRSAARALDGRASAEARGCAAR